MARIPKVPALIRTKTSEYGPAMMALNERQRKFVEGLFVHSSRAEAARQAGYSDTAQGAKVLACRMVQQPKIQSAITEWLKGETAGEFARIGVMKLVEIAQTDGHRDQAKAAQFLAQAGGIAPTTQHNVEVKVTLTREEKISKLREFAEVAGIPFEKALGVIDLDASDYEEIEDGS